MRRQAIAVVAIRAVSGEVGGAERAYAGLVQALTARGIDADLITVVTDESSPEALQESALRLAELDLGSYYGVITTKWPAYLLRHRNHVVLLMHPVRVFYDLWEEELARTPAAVRLRHEVLCLDRNALSRGRVRKLFAIGVEPAQRMRQQLGVDLEVLRIPSDLTGLHEGPFEHLLSCGRLHPWKRVDLIVAAMRLARARVRLRIVGTGCEEQALRDLAGDDDRIVFEGRVADRALVDLYARAVAVLFTPIREDLGFVTLEAFASGKPVITCRDSGEPARLVRHGDSGLVCESTPEALAAAIDRLCADHSLAAALGRRGREDARRITWDPVVDRLASVLGVAVPAAS